MIITLCENILHLQLPVAGQWQGFHHPILDQGTLIEICLSIKCKGNFHLIRCKVHIVALLPTKPKNNKSFIHASRSSRCLEQILGPALSPESLHITSPSGLPQKKTKSAGLTAGSLPWPAMRLIRTSLCWKQFFFQPIPKHQAT